MQIGKGGHKGANLWYKRRILSTEKGVGGIGQKEERGGEEGRGGERASGRRKRSKQLSVINGQSQLAVLKSKAKGRRGEREKMWK